MNHSMEETQVSTVMKNYSRFELLSLILKHQFSQGVFCEELDDCWQTEDSWGGLMTDLFNGGERDITGDDNSLFFEWLSSQLKNSYQHDSFFAYPDWSLFHFCGSYQYPLEVAWLTQYDFVVVLCACYFVCWWPSKGEIQISNATTSVMF